MCRSVLGGCVESCFFVCLLLKIFNTSLVVNEVFTVVFFALSVHFFRIHIVYMFEN